MGDFLREALKTICGVNQWSYALFWKIGCQNTQLLIWEDCYYEPAQCPILSCFSGSDKMDLPFGEWEGSWSAAVPTSQLGVRAWEKINSLVKKMMNDQINVVGQGIVGRAAFTGSHQWILARNYNKSGQPPEVLNELQVQFTAGMQTVAVIPILPHGVVQLGSFSAIMENLEFVDGVKRLILQLGCVPEALLSTCYGTIDSDEKIRLPISLEMSVCADTPGILATNSLSSMGNSCNEQNNSVQAPMLVIQPSSLVRPMQINPHGSLSTSGLATLEQNLAKPHNGRSEPKINPNMGADLNSRKLLESGVVGAEVIPSNTALWLKHQVSSCNLGSQVNSHPQNCQSATSYSSEKLMNGLILSDTGAVGHVTGNMGKQKSEVRQLSLPGFVSNLHKQPNVSFSPIRVPGNAVQNVDLSKPEVPPSVLKNQPATSHMLSGVSKHSYNSDSKQHSLVCLVPKNDITNNDLFQAFNMPCSHAENHLSMSEKHNSVPFTDSSAHDCLKQESEVLSPGLENAKFREECIGIPSGDDLFDVLGADLKNKLLNGRWNDVLSDVYNVKTDLGKEIRTPEIMQDALSHVFSANGGIADRSLFSGMATDHLLDAVVSGAHSVPKQIVEDDVSCKTTVTKISSSSIHSSTSYDQGNLSNQVKQELLSLPKSPVKAGTMASTSHHSRYCKDDSGNCSQTTVYGSPISSWVDQGHNASRDSSISTAYSKRNSEMTKPTRKRLKPGENPRPRPKDRQMIQDRVKELREIVPNGAKCSIDALLERTIKHMLFLQSVTKHADKLKQTRESKIINNEGGMLLKDNFEGGATWAFEVGSQSMVCPIIVEDLNPPRQLLVEMLCEERGFFLEIADLIRGLGLTILKGVMETRNDKIWARFAVEANRDVTRIEIFMSLVRLLEQTMKSSTPSANALDSSNMLVHHSFAQAPSITAVGRASMQ